MAALATEVGPLDELVEQLGDASGPIDGFRESYRRLRRIWGGLFGDPALESTDDTGDSADLEAAFEEAQGRLEVLLADALQRVATAESEFAGIATLTDRLTWSVFTVSLLIISWIAVATVRFLKRTLDRYVSPQVASSLLESSTRLEMGGRRIRITALMADLRGFSGLAERLPPETVVTMINNFLEVMTEVILDYGGTIDEFIGDAILVFFGAPEPREDHARTAIACGIAMQAAMERVHRRSRELGLPELEMGIGINTGDAVVGNVGSMRRAKFGAVGRHVNLAARIQSIAVGGQVMVSERTALEAGWDLKIRDGVKISPKGFSKPVGIVDVRGIGGEYDLQLPDSEPEMTPLAEPLPAEVSLMTESGPVATWVCTVSAVSQQRAELRSDRTVPLLSSVLIRIADPETDEPIPDIYAKVVNAGGSSGLDLVARFTSVPPEAGRILETLSGP